MRLLTAQKRSRKTSLTPKIRFGFCSAQSSSEASLGDTRIADNINSRGEVIGVNTAMILPAQGICFAIASNTAQLITGWLVKEGRVRRSYVGIAGQTTPIHARLRRHYRLTQDRGVLVVRVEPGSPARLAGLSEGDIIVAFKGQPISGVDELLRKLVAAEIGIASVLTVLRQIEKIEIHITPQELIRGDSLKE